MLPTAKHTVALTLGLSQELTKRGRPTIRQTPIILACF